MNGKHTCRILKEIRRTIAQQNDIALVIDECTFQGECRGTCPKCEAEVRYLENELEKRRLSGKAVTVAGIAASVMLLASGCTADVPPAPTEPTDPTCIVEPLDGDVAYVPDGEPDLIGEVPNDAYSETDGYGEYYE